jgi:hypothetical protein
LVNTKLFELGNIDHQLPPRIYQIKPLFPITVSWGSSVTIVTRLQDGLKRGLSGFPVGEIFSSFPQLSDHFWGLYNFLSNRGSSPGMRVPDPENVPSPASNAMLKLRGATLQFLPTIHVEVLN